MQALKLPEPFFLATEPIHFSKGIDGVVGVCRNILEKEPMEEGSFVFHNRARTQFMILFYDGDGFWLCKKRFSKGKLPKPNESEAPFREVDLRELFIFLWRGKGQVQFPEWWNKS